MAISVLDSPATAIDPQTVAPHAVPKPQKRTKNSHRPRRLGTFRKLPAEVRLHIWQYLMPELRDDDEPSLSSEAFGSPVVVPAQRNGNRLTILRTSRALKKEIEAELYRLRSLKFTIRPERRGWRVESLPGSTMTDFVHTNFLRFNSIKVDIYRHQRDDPAQLLYTRTSIYNIVRLLRGNKDDIGQCEPYSTRNDRKQLNGELTSNCICDKSISKTCAKIPRIEVTFLDEGSNTWLDDGYCNYTFLDTSCFGSDLGVLTSAFGYLHMVQSISFTFPEGLRPDSGIIKTVTSIQKFVSDFPTWGWDYIDFSKGEMDHYLGLDWALDTATGPAAAILRRERLIHNRWYRRSVKPLLDYLTHSGEYYTEYEAPALERYRDFQSLDRLYVDHGWKLHITQDPKWLEEWRGYWPNGIPPKGSAEWNVLIASASRF